MKRFPFVLSLAAVVLRRRLQDTSPPFGSRLCVDFGLGAQREWRNRLIKLLFRRNRCARSLKASFLTASLNLHATRQACDGMV